MVRCSACGTEIGATARFCSSCGRETVGVRGEPTLDAPTAGIEPPRSRPTRDGGRFAAGTLILDRFRIVSLLGRGGMGEVYRADDLKLEQVVALKFLPESAGQRGELLQRLMSEVRLARQISHPNVCRVYDVAEWGATHFLSMEYIDGENLAALLARIGRLPRDKACQIARQLCAGLAAAHARGVLHRDLKPANVMIDGQGNARITDFGLAGLREGVPAEEAGLGTPAYMAPEQLAGREVSAQSDLWSLGLLLYELFTGRRAFEAGTRRELARQQESRPAGLSSLVAGIDPAVERAVMRCLEGDPHKRPSSALAVAAALPGGDPLAAALEAGETPSPELVAAARSEGGLAPRTAWLCLALVLGAFALDVALSGQTQISGQVALPKSTQVLADRAREIARALGYSARPRDSRWGFDFDARYFEWTAARDSSARRWESLATHRPPVVYFWYRQSARPLMPLDRWAVPSPTDPPSTVPGMVSIELDPQGRVAALQAVPPEHQPPGPPAAEPDWEALLTLAELDPDRLRVVEPLWTPPFWADRRVAWEGELPGDPAGPVRAEAAAARGRPVWFRIFSPWAAPTDYEEGETNPWRTLAQGVFFAATLAIILGAVLIARRNLRLGRSDRQGAFWLAVYLLSVRLLVWLVGGPHVAAFEEIRLLMAALAAGLFRFGLAWLFYVAIEPYLRRFWPRVLVSWVRLLRGRFRDPLVGRHLLLGCLFGLATSSIYKLQPLVAGWLGQAAPRLDLLAPLTQELQALAGPRQALSILLTAQDNAGLNLLFGVTLLIVLRLLVRDNRLAVVLWVALALFGFNPGSGVLWMDLAFLLAWLLLAALVLFRLGLLALLVAWTVSNAVVMLPLTFDLSAWHAHATLLALTALLALAAWGFYVSLAGRPLFQDELAG